MDKLIRIELTEKQFMACSAAIITGIKLIQGDTFSAVKGLSAAEILWSELSTEDKDVIKNMFIKVHESIR